MVRIRMKSMGRRHRPFFRICAIDARRPRDGRPIEELGHYDPMSRNPETQTVLDVSRIRYWLSVGAQPSEKVQAILRQVQGQEARARGAVAGAGDARTRRRPRRRPRSGAAAGAAAISAAAGRLVIDPNRTSPPWPVRRRIASTC